MSPLAAAAVRTPPLVAAATRRAATMARRDLVKIVEVGPRDGLQNEPMPVPTEVKQALIRRLTRDAGVRHIEAAAMVSPKWVPQMADGEAVLAMPRLAGVVYSVLTPNAAGLERAVRAGCDEVAVFGAASEAFSRRNINCSIDESLARFRDVVRAAPVPVRGYVSCVLGCPYQGAVAPADVARVAHALLDMGCHEVSLGDTIGVGTPGAMAALLDHVLATIPAHKIAVHCHDTYGQALANIAVALARGIRTVDASVAGLGGCPYAKGASGNVATEDVVYMLHGMGYATGIDLPKLAMVGDWISTELKRPNGSKVGRAIAAAIKETGQPPRWALAPETLSKSKL